MYQRDKQFQQSTRNRQLQTTARDTSKRPRAKVLIFYINRTRLIGYLGMARTMNTFMIIIIIIIIGHLNILFFIAPLQ